jgi:hypothetical protein
VAKRIEVLEGLLRRIYGWDVMDSPHGVGAYWRNEIDSVLRTANIGEAP